MWACWSGCGPENGQQRVSPAVWLGRILAFSSVGYLSGLLYFGWIFWLQDFPRGGNPLGALVLLAFYVPAISALGSLLGCWFGSRERALQVLLFTSLPMAFVSGFSWPIEALPEGLQALRWLFPSTAGIQASLRLNQMGAPLADVSHYLLILSAIGGISGLWLLWMTRPEKAKTTI